MAQSQMLLKTQQLATALSKSPSSIKRWIDTEEIKAERTVGGHRLVAWEEAHRFAIERGYSTAGLEKLLARKSMSPILGMPKIEGSLRDRLFDAARAGNLAETRALVHQGYLAGRGVAGLADDLIGPVMHRIGHQWEIGDVEIYQEHAATQAITSAIHDLITTRIKPAQTGTSIALGATPEGDPYILPLSLGEAILREQGWDVRNLGCNLPLDSLTNAVREFRPKFVFLTVSVLTDIERFINSYNTFYKAASMMDVAVMLGGRALGSDLRSRLVYTGFGDRLTHLAEFSRRLLPPSNAPDTSLANQFRSTDRGNLQQSS